METVSQPYRIRSHRELLLGFGAIIFVLVGTTVLAVSEHRKIRGEVKSIVDDSLTSVRLIGRLRQDVGRHHLMLLQYLTDSSPAAKRAQEEALAQLDADLVSAMRAYESHTTLPGERDAWERLRNDVIAVHDRSANILELARQNQNERARAMLDAQAELYIAIRRDADALSTLEANEASAAMARIDSIQSLLLTLLFVVAVSGILTTLGVGIAVDRLIRRREERVARYAAELEARNGELDAFSGRVAHDLRGPLTAIKLGVTQIRDRASDASALADRFHRSVARMEAIIDDLLSLSRLQPGTKTGHCDPASVVAQLAEELRPRLDAEAGTLRIEVDPAKVACGAGLFRQVVWNLADNALKYSRPGVPPVVQIRGVIAHRRYELRVSDNGIGMPPEESEKVFLPFFRSAGVQTRPGTGLGLTIVRRVIEASGGSVSVTSRVGEGSAFVLSLPIANPSDASGPSWSERSPPPDDSSLRH
jgi:signal transduction histidine kinase